MFLILRVRLASLHNQTFWGHPQRHIHKCVSMVTLNPVKLTVKINHHIFPVLMEEASKLLKKQYVEGNAVAFILENIVFQDYKPQD